MKTRVTASLLCLCILCLAMPGCSDPAAPLSVGTGRFEFPVSSGGGRARMTVWYHNPGVTPAAQVVFVMHGRQRNGEKYRDAWIEYADRGHFLLLVPEFSKDHFPESEHYNLGNIITEEGRPVAEPEWAFTTIERIFDHAKAAAGLTTAHYDIYGHSAGAQFVHRLVMFKQGARIHTAVAANAGWYTMPDFKTAFPYGLAGASYSETMLARALSRKLIVLLGTEDTDEEHKSLRKTPEAMRQGSNRLERGEKFFATARAAAEARDVPFNWELKKVAGVSHSNSRMAPAAAELLQRR